MLDLLLCFCSSFQPMYLLTTRILIFIGWYISIWWWIKTITKVKSWYCHNLQHHSCYSPTVSTASSTWPSDRFIALTWNLKKLFYAWIYEIYNPNLQFNNILHKESRPPNHHLVKQPQLLAICLTLLTRPIELN